MKVSLLALLAVIFLIGHVQSTCFPNKPGLRCRRACRRNRQGGPCTRTCRLHPTLDYCLPGAANAAPTAEDIAADEYDEY